MKALPKISSCITLNYKSDVSLRKKMALDFAQKCKVIFFSSQFTLTSYLLQIHILYKFEIRQFLVKSFQFILQIKTLKMINDFCQNFQFSTFFNNEFFQNSYICSKKIAPQGSNSASLSQLNSDVRTVLCMRSTFQKSLIKSKTVLIHFVSKMVRKQ